MVKMDATYGRQEDEEKEGEKCGGRRIVGKWRPLPSSVIQHIQSENSSALIQKHSRTEWSRFWRKEADLTRDDKNGHKICMSSFSRCALNVNTDCSQRYGCSYHTVLLFMDSSRCLSFPASLSLRLFPSGISVTTGFNSHVEYLFCDPLPFSLNPFKSVTLFYLNLFYGNI